MEEQQGLEIMLNNVCRKYKATHMKCMVNLKYSSSQHLDGAKSFTHTTLKWLFWPREWNMYVFATYTYMLNQLKG